MIILVHVTFALTSIVSTTVLAAFPSKAKMYLSYGLIAATLISGTLLIILTHVSILKTCISGLVYLCVVLAGLAFARHRLNSSEDI